MTTVTTVEVEHQIRDLLKRVERGEEVLITKHEKPIARIVPQSDKPSQAMVSAVDAIFKLRKKIQAESKGKKKLTYAEVKSARDEGRP